MAKDELRLTDTVILYDRDFGVSIFQNFRGYDSLLDDAEWLLERTSRRSRGFIMRIVVKNDKRGIWIGEYPQGERRIRRQEIIFGDSGESVSKTILDYVNKKISEESLLRRIRVENLRKSLNSEILRDFNHYRCPSYRFLHECPHVDKIYSRLTERYGKGEKVPYSLVVEEIEGMETCEDVIVCPLFVPNLFERLLNLSKAFKSRRLGEITFAEPDFVEIR